MFSTHVCSQCNTADPLCNDELACSDIMTSSWPIPQFHLGLILSNFHSSLSGVETDNLLLSGQVSHVNKPENTYLFSHNIVLFLQPLCLLLGDF